MNSLRFASRSATFLVLLAPLFFAIPAHAERNTLGPHLGVNFDVDDAFLGLEGRFDVGNLGRSAIVQLNPSFSYYFIEGGDLFNFSFNVPFEFQIDGSVLRPMVAPGLGIWHWSGNDHSDTDLSLNLIAGLLFALGVVEPFVQLKIAIGDGSSAELMGGVLFRL